MERGHRMRRKIDRASLATIIITISLFVIAIFEKGLTHELLLEAGVFLVSVKMILSSAKADLATEAILERLSELDNKLNH